MASKGVASTSRAEPADKCKRRIKEELAPQDVDVRQRGGSKKAAVTKKPAAETAEGEACDKANKKAKKRKVGTGITSWQAFIHDSSMKANDTKNKKYANVVRRIS